MAQERTSRSRLQMTRPRLHKERFVAVFLLGILVFNPPLLSIFSVDTLVLGVPLLYLYLFAAWIVVIALLRLTADPGDDTGAGGQRGSRPEGDQRRG